MRSEEPPESRSSTRRLVWLFVGALALRIAVAVVMGLHAPPEPGSDAQEYDVYAWNLLQGRGYRGLSPDVSDHDHLTAYRPPLPSILWAGLYGLFGHRYEVVRLAYCVLGAVSVLLLFSIGRRVFGEGVAWVAAIVWAVFPTALFYSSTLSSEPITAFLLPWFVLACLRFASRPTRGRATLAGTVLGLMLLTHASKVFMVPLVALWAAWQFRAALGTALQALSIPLVACLLLIPWTVRNYLVFDTFIPFSTMGGSVLLQGNNRVVVTDPGRYGYNVWDTKIPEYADALRAPNDEIERDRVARRLAVEWLTQNREKWPWLVQAKLRRAFTPLLQPHSPRLFRMGTLLGWGPVLLLFAPAFFPTWWDLLRRGHPGWLIHLAVVDYILLTVIFFGYSRYRYPIESFCVLLAAAAALFLLSRIRGHAPSYSL